MSVHEETVIWAELTLVGDSTIESGAVSVHDELLEDEAWKATNEVTVSVSSTVV